MSKIYDQLRTSFDLGPDCVRICELICGNFQLSPACSSDVPVQT